MTIKNAKDANAAWSRLQKKYEKLAQSLYQDKPLVRENKIPSDLSTDFLNYEVAAKKLQHHYRNASQRNAYFKYVNPKGSHSALFLYFLNETNPNAIQKRSDPEAQLALSEALAQKKWEEILFDEKYYFAPMTALALYDSQKISMQQFFTLLEWVQLTKARHLFPIKAFHSILKPNGEFTQASVDYLLPLFFKDHPPDVHEAFKHLIQALPVSEQSFCVSSDDGLVKHEKLQTPEGELASILAQTQTIAYDEGKHDVIHLSFGVRDALGIAQYGQHYVPIFPRLHEQSINEIEHGVRCGIRPAAIQYHQIRSFKNIHNFNLVTSFEATTHDYYHAQGLSALDPEIRKTMLLFVDRLREFTQLKWSKEMWALIDADFPTLKYADKEEQFNRIFRSILMLDKHLTLPGSLILVDLMTHQRWHNVNLPFAEMIAKILNPALFSIIASLVKNQDSSLVKALKCQVLSTFQSSLSTDEMMMILQSKQLQAATYQFTKSKKIETKNTIVLEQNHSPLSLDDLKNQLLNPMHRLLKK